MNQVAIYNEGNWSVTHYWMLDDIGFKKNYIEVQKEEKGMKIIYPIQAPMRVQVNSEIYSGEDISPFEPFEYAEMLNKVRDV